MNPNRPPIQWTPQMLRMVRDYYPITFGKDLARWLGVSLRTLERKARELGVEKEPDFLVKRNADIQRRASEALKKKRFDNGRFVKGKRNNPSGEFRPGHKESPEAKEKRIAGIKRAFAEKKRLQQIDKITHPEKYIKQ